MEKMSREEIVHFLKNNIEPLNDANYGAGYRASVYLVDGTFLPCVMFRSPKPIVELAMKRFEQEKNGNGIFAKSVEDAYYNVVRNFVTSGNCINDYDIARIEESRFAFPVPLLSQIEGETTMGWTGFSVKMKDGNIVGFGTSFQMAFFQMPDNYEIEDMEEIVNHSYVSKTGELQFHEVPFFESPADYDKGAINRERPFFKCFIDGL